MAYRLQRSRGHVTTVVYILYTVYTTKFKVEVYKTLLHLKLIIIIPVSLDPHACAGWTLKLTILSSLKRRLTATWLWTLQYV